MEQRRLYVGGISRQSITAAALQELLSKVCPVGEVYVPAQSQTGLGKDFAIAVMEGRDAKELGDRCARCIKAFNNSLWRGSRLRVEHAKEYYRDRFLKAKQELQEEATDEDSGGDDDKADEEGGVFDTGFLRLKRSRYSSAIEVNLLARVGSSSHAKRVLLDSTGRRLSGQKLLFDEHGDVTNYDTSLFYEPPPPAQIAERVPKPDPNLREERRALSAPAAEGMQGGGQRRGFGTLVRSSKSREDDACCVEAPIGKALQTRPLLDTFDGDDDDEPCLQPQDVTEEVLSEERQRQLRAMAAMLGAGEAVKAPASIIVMDGDRTVQYDGKTKQDQKRAAKQQQQQGSHADLTVLKNIFHREGGVWWGDDGSLKSSVARGDVVQDRLFLEAEKMGFDIRTDGAEGKTMHFGFFDDHEEGAAAGPAAAPGAEGVSEAMDVCDEPPAPAAAPPSLLEVVRRARLFCRDGSAEQATEQWKAARERLAADYKRKRKDNRKKVGQRSAAAASAERGADRGSSNAALLGGSQERRYGHKAQKRGGRKHAKLDKSKA